MSCLFEPIHGRYPTRSLCDSYPDCVGCSYSDSFKQPKQTNADRIRNMTDEELANELGFVAQDAFCYGRGLRDKMILYPFGSYEETLEWLKQEAEGGDSS